MAIEPIGGIARNFLRSVHLSEGPFQFQPDEMELVMTCMAAGYLKRSRPIGPRVSITEDGIAYLDKLARCE
jgi:hypothetical protein